MSKTLDELMEKCILDKDHESMFQILSHVTNLAYPNRDHYYEEMMLIRMEAKYGLDWVKENMENYKKKVKQ
jgi:hypothetical protein